MKRSFFKPSTSSIAAVVLGLLVFVPALAAPPSANPPNGNVNANFSSLNIGTTTTSNLTVDVNGVLSSPNAPVTVNDALGFNIIVPSSTIVPSAFKVSGKTGGGTLNVNNDGSIAITNPSATKVQGFGITGGANGSSAVINSDGSFIGENKLTIGAPVFSASGWDFGNLITINNNGTMNLASAAAGKTAMISAIGNHLLGAVKIYNNGDLELNGNISNPTGNLVTVNNPLTVNGHLKATSIGQFYVVKVGNSIAANALSPQVQVSCNSTSDILLSCGGGGDITAPGAFDMNLLRISDSLGSTCIAQGKNTWASARQFDVSARCLNPNF